MKLKRKPNRKTERERFKAYPRWIGVVHLPPLPGSPGAARVPFDVTMGSVGALALEEVRTFEAAGFDAVILENFGDVPFFKSEVPPETVAAMSIIAAAARQFTKLKVGINVLRNDARAAMAIASVTGCDFIRVNVLSGVAATDQGLIESDAATLMRARELRDPRVSVLADVHVKHAVTLSGNDLEIAIEDLIVRTGADGVVITGPTTGRVTETERLTVARAAVLETGKRVRRVPLYLGSGLSAENARDVLPYVDGAIVGSSVRRGGVAGAPLDRKALKKLRSLLE